MKKIFTLLLLSLLVFNTQAQMSVGVKGGLNASNILFPKGSNQAVIYATNGQRVQISNKRIIEKSFETNFLKMFSLGPNAGIFLRLPLEKKI